jgi:hypothetical protein
MYLICPRERLWGGMTPDTIEIAAQRGGAEYVHRLEIVASRTRESSTIRMWGETSLEREYLFSMTYGNDWPRERSSIFEQ